MKISKPAVIVAAVAMVVGGGIAADAATTTSPVKLCANKIVQTVSLPKNGNCPSNATAFYVASQADVAALAGRVDALEAVDNSAVLARIAALESSSSSQAGKITALETLTSAQAAKIADLEQAIADLTPSLSVTSRSILGGRYAYTATGTGLKPGSIVTLRYRDLSTTPEDIGTVDGLGKFTYQSALPCGYGPIIIDGTARNDSPVTSGPYTGAGCS